MTPREKAEQMVDSFWAVAFNPYFSSEMIRHESINICRNCIDEIIEACEYNHVESYNTDWWNKVKEELENL